MYRPIQFCFCSAEPITLNIFNDTDAIMNCVGVISHGGTEKKKPVSVMIVFRQNIQFWISRKTSKSFNKLIIILIFLTSFNCIGL